MESIIKLKEHFEALKLQNAVLQKGIKDAESRLKTEFKLTNMKGVSDEIKRLTDESAKLTAKREGLYEKIKAELDNVRRLSNGF